MLPFLKSRKIASVILQSQKKDGSAEPIREEGEHYPELLKASEDLISAVNSKDANAVSSALLQAFSCLEKHEGEPNE